MFPKEPVIIKQENHAQVIANPNVVVLYNDNLSYRREKISEWGDRCDFLDVDTDVLIDSISRFDPSVVEREDAPFRFTNVTVSNDIFVLQKQVFQSLGQESQVSMLALEESLLQLVDNVVETIYRNMRRESSCTSRSVAKQLELVHACKLLLCRRFREHLSIAQIAASLKVSPSHLRRIFKSQTNETIHQFLTRLRLRTALERVRYANDLTQVALTLGFSSHSHFSAAFRRAFGLTPSCWRRTCSC